MTPRKRATLRGEVVFEGRGIHSGELSAVTVAPYGEGRGIAFSFGAKEYSVSEAAVDGSMRSTTLVFPGGERVRTTEHLLAAIAGVGLDDVLIAPRGEELPILDGSALPFAEAIISRGFREFESQYRPPSLSSPICLEIGVSFIAALPSDELKVTYVVDYPDYGMGPEIKDIAVTPENFVAEIAPARTFCFAAEAAALRKNGFGLGGDRDNVLIIGDGGSHGRYRVPSECASHKIADLLGDIALAGSVTRAHYVCVCGGHKLHAKMADRVKRSLSNSGR
jgi:UDP-3-O-[3-hydroxymyristoyl] N-acetylglucosamine deacetylase